MGKSTTEATHTERHREETHNWAKREFSWRNTERYRDETSQRDTQGDIQGETPADDTQDAKTGRTPHESQYSTNSTGKRLFTA
jgi:hypothetical protein